MPTTSIPALLKFASNIETTSSTLMNDLRAKIPSFPLDNVQSKHRTALETHGTDLWNVATRYKRSSTEANHDERIKVALLRVFAFGMLDGASQSRQAKTKRAETCLRMLKTALKCLQACIDADELEVAGKVAQRAAHWNDEAEGVVEDDLRTKLGGEYFIRRMALAWKQDKLDVAEHMYQKFWKNDIRPHFDIMEDLADILYELGKSLCDKKLYDTAAVWLERAVDAIDDQELDMFSDDASELRLAIMQQLVKSLIMSKDATAIDKARHVIGIINHSYPNKLVAALLGLELLAMEQSPSALEYSDVLSKIVRTTTLTRSNFKTYEIKSINASRAVKANITRIMHHIHKLKKLDALFAIKVLDELIIHRLSREVEEEWVERACMTRIWITTAVANSIADCDTLKEILDGVRTAHSRPFSSSAAHAAQTLLWKHIETAYDAKSYELAESLCDLALHTLFEKCGEMNHAKIARKWILCAINRGRDVVAREVYFRLPQSQRDTSETRYLMHKVALHSGDLELAQDCLHMVAKQSNKDATRLYACVLDALDLADEKYAFLALKQVLETYDHKVPRGVHLPALLRCMVCLIRTNLKDTANDPEATNEAISTMSSLFDAAVRHSKKTSMAKNDFNAEEIAWFSKNSYNVAIEFLGQLEPPILYRLCLCSSQLIGLLDRDTPPMEKANPRLRHIFCEYLALTVVVTLARGEDNIEVSSNHYTAACKHGHKLRSLIAEQMEVDGLSELVKADLRGKHIQSIKFELEANLHIKKWDAMSDLFDQCWKYEDPKHWETLADLAFSLHEELCTMGSELLQTYQKVILDFIQRVVNKSWRPNEPLAKLAKHLRCLFHLTLSKEDNTAASCFDQVIDIVSKSKMSKVPYPAEELEWMAATAFNQAVSYFCVKDDANCHFWAEKALTLSAHAADDGALADELREKYAKLRWSEA